MSSKDETIMANALEYVRTRIYQMPEMMDVYAGIDWLELKKAIDTHKDKDA